MKKKFCLALLLIAAMCLSAVAAQADPLWLEGTWEMGDGDGKLDITPEGKSKIEEVDVDATGKVRFTISNVVVAGDGESGTFTLSSNGGYMISLVEPNPELPSSIPIDMTKAKTNDVPFLVEGETTITTTIPVEDVPALFVIELIDESSADVSISFSFEETGEFVVDGELEFEANKIPSNNSSSSGGCDTGAGFGLFLALGALAISKRAKRKA